MYKLFVIVVVALCYVPQVEGNTGKSNVEAISVNEKHLQAILVELETVKSEMKILKEENSNIKTVLVELKEENSNYKEENQMIQSRLNKLETNPRNHYIRSRSLEDNFISFSAYATVTREYQAGQIILFDEKIRNYGTDYNTGSSIFTAPVGGLYLFFCTIITGNGDKMSAHLYLENEFLVGVFASDYGEDSSSSMVVTHVAAGQQVMVRCLGDGHVLAGNENRESTFSGVLLQLE